MTFEDELEKWIVTYLVTHPDHEINTGVIIDNAPRSLIIQMSSDIALHDFLRIMEGKGILRNSSWGISFKLTNQGKLYFRKFIEPLFLIAKDKKQYSQIIEQIEGKPETRKGFKKLLDSISNLKPDDAERVVVKFLIEESVDMIWYLVKLLLTAHSAS